MKFQPWKRKAVQASVIALLLSCGWFGLRQRDKGTDERISSTVLTPEETAKVIVNPKRHTIVVVTRNPSGGTETKATFLPRGGASVSIGKGGKITTNARTWGTEVAPFVGAALGTDIRLRLATGVNVFYWHRWEFGGGAIVGNLKDARAFMHVSYNAYDNWYLALGADNRGTAHLMAGLKF